MPPIATPRLEAEPPKVLVLPEKKEIALRLYDYLFMKRGIDNEVIKSCEVARNEECDGYT